MDFPGSVPQISGPQRPQMNPMQWLSQLMQGQPQQQPQMGGPQQFNAQPQQQQNMGLGQSLFGGQNMLGFNQPPQGQQGQGMPMQILPPQQQQASYGDPDKPFGAMPQPGGGKMGMGQSLMSMLFA